MKAIAAISAIGALAMSTHALAGDQQPDPSMSIHVGTFVNTGWGQITYDGNFSQYISVTAAPQNQTMFPTRIAVDLSGLLTDAGYNAFTEVSFVDAGVNTYTANSPGADIDWVSFAGLDDGLSLTYSYDGPVDMHRQESSPTLATRVSVLDALSGHPHDGDVRHVSLGEFGKLTAIVNGWIGDDGSGDDGGGDDGGGEPGGPDVPTPSLTRGIGSGVSLHFSESGMGESFDVYVTPANVPSPGAAVVLAIGGALSRRRRRRA